MVRKTLYLNTEKKCNAKTQMHNIVWTYLHNPEAEINSSGQVDPLGAKEQLRLTRNNLNVL